MALVWVAQQRTGEFGQGRYHLDVFDAAEEDALRRTEAHADLADGQLILELGYGCGSLSF